MSYRQTTFEVASGSGDTNPGLLFRGKLTIDPLVITVLQSIGPRHDRKAFQAILYQGPASRNDRKLKTGMDTIIHEVHRPLDKNRIHKFWALLKFLSRSTEKWVTDVPRDRTKTEIVFTYVIEVAKISHIMYFEHQKKRGRREEFRLLSKPKDEWRPEGHLQVLSF